MRRNALIGPVRGCARRTLACLWAVLALLAMGAAAAQASTPHVIPFANTPDASPATSIIFLSLAPSELRSLSVIGSHSGRHDGLLRALPDGRGTAFVPRIHFEPGEHVSVGAALSSPSAAAGPGGSRRTNLRTSFTVERPATVDPVTRQAPRRNSGTGPTMSFRSAPQLHPPKLTVTSNPDLGSGDIFLTPFNSPQLGPMILNGRGKLLWFDGLRRGEALNLQVQRYRSRPVLTWWRGALNAGHGTIFGVGSDRIMDSSYRTRAVVRAGNGYSADLHEFQITPRDTALLDAYVPVHKNLTSEGGPSDGTVVDCVVQEVDIKTGDVLWEWHALGHVPVSASHWPVPRSSTSYDDYFHLNSIQQLPDGNFVISSRNTWAIYEISRNSGRVIWTLGGKRSSFRMGPGTSFEWQHDARMHPGGILSVFDDASIPQEERQASAKVLRLDTKARTARLLRRYNHSPPVLAELAGNAQILPNHNVFVGWGGAPDFSEYTADGRQIFNGSFAIGVGSYRALRFRWTGSPRTLPAVASASGPHGTVFVYASWNGATRVARWKVLGGSSPRSLHPLGRSARRRGFETAVTLKRRVPRYLAVQAVSRAGHVLGTSRTISAP